MVDRSSGALALHQNMWSVVGLVGIGHRVIEWRVGEDGEEKAHHREMRIRDLPTKCCFLIGILRRDMCSWC